MSRDMLSNRKQESIDCRKDWKNSGVFGHPKVSGLCAGALPPTWQREGRERTCVPAACPGVCGSGAGKRLVDLVERAGAWVELHADDETMSVTKLASALNMSRTSLHRKLVRVTGLAPGEFIRGVRLQLANRLLREGDCNVSQVAYAVGFVSLSGFSRAYRSRYGEPPSSLRQQPGE
jgi:AraC-like DNA-binding protein